MIQNAARPRGRPRSFNESAALEQAIQVFWSKGYDGVTVDDLVAGMGVGRPSLYSIFGDKRTLFLRVLRAYAEKKGALAAAALHSPGTLRDSLSAFMRNAVETATKKGSARGCLLMCVAPLVDDAEVRQFLKTAQQAPSSYFRPLSPPGQRVATGCLATKSRPHRPCREAASRATASAAVLVRVAPPVGRACVLADVRLGRVPDDFVGRFLDVYSAVSDGQPPPEVTEGDENAIRVAVRLSSVTRSIRISQYAHPVVLEENFVQLRIGYCRIYIHFASLLRFAGGK